MPLTIAGKEILQDFQNMYGTIEGKRRFYAYMNKYPKRVKKWHKR